MPSVTFEHVSKRFGETTVVEDFDLQVDDGELLVLVGGSGSGKSTILRMLAGLEEVTSGKIRIDERDVTTLPPRDRDVAMVFQDYGLYPHMTVRENLSLGLRLRKVPRQEIERRVTWAGGMLGLEPLLDRKPKQLSGGQRQRVAMGRAMVREPLVFLFDEPLSNLDAGLRAQMRIEIGGLQRRLKTTTVYVTHDQVEAMTLGDRIVVLADGRIQQIGRPIELYTAPVNRFVAGFIGSPAMNLLPCKLDGSNGGLSVRLSDNLTLALPPDRVARYREHAGRELLFGLRPEDIIEKRGDLPAGRVGFDVQLDVVEPMGMETMVYFIVEGVEVCGRVNPNAAGKAGETMPLVADLNHMHLIDPRTDLVL